MPLRLFACAAIVTMASSAADAQERLRWELVSNGTSEIGSGDGTSATAPVPKLTGSDATFLFRLDAQPFLNYGATMHAKRSTHLTFVTGVTGIGRAVTARAETSASPVVESLGHQGAVVTGTLKPGTTLTRQRAFTVGTEFSANRLFQAQGQGAFMELGFVGKGHFDAFLDDDRVFEKDGLTYIKVGNPAGGHSGYYGAEAGLRFRVSQPAEQAMTSTDAGGDTDTKGGNVDDLLLFEFLYQRNNAAAGLLSGVDTQNRVVMRFLATPVLPNLANTKMLVGIEVNNDRQGKGVKDIRIFYGANLDLKSLF